MNKPWFKAKMYGYGWYPATWQGWLVVGLWTVAFLRLAYYFGETTSRTGDPAHLFWFGPLAVLLIAALVWISWATGEPARWRWGKKDK